MSTLRYVAIQWNSTNANANLAATTLLRRFDLPQGAWRSALDMRGLAVLYQGTHGQCATPVITLGRSGVVVGVLFPKPEGEDETPRSIQRFDPVESERILRERGAPLFNDYWGAYVAFGQETPGGDAWLLRDPTGLIQSLMIAHDGLNIVCSDIRSIACLRIPLTLNTDYVAAQLCAGEVFECRETAINEVAAVLGGERISFGNSGVARELVWTPSQIASRPVASGLKELSDVARHTVRSCVRAWGAHYASVIHQLSGGLDSSIVLSCFRSPTIPSLRACVNFYSTGHSSDERSFAHLAAAHAGCDLVEAERRSSVSLDPILRCALSARPNPSSCIYSALFGRDMTELARRDSATAIFCGELGDQIFFQNPARLATIDYIALNGIDANLFAVALDVARLEGLSVWRAAWQGLRAATQEKHADKRIQSGTLPLVPSRNGFIADAAACADPRRFLHPWVDCAATVPPGKRWHLSRIFDQSVHGDPLADADDPPRILPLYSQPIIEFFLRIPIYSLIKGGWDRAIARRAFMGDLPRAIVLRRTKGDREAHAKTVTLRNVAFMREMLVDGQLAKLGLVDKAQLERTIGGAPSKNPALLNDLHWLLGTEAWLRAWTSSQLNSPPATAIRHSEVRAATLRSTA